MSGWGAFVQLKKNEETLVRVAKLATYAAGTTDSYMTRMAFNDWHRQQAATELERMLANGCCAAVVYWLKSSCGRCAPRDIEIPPDFAQRLRSKGCCCI